MDLKIVLAPLEIIKHKNLEKNHIESNQNSSVRKFILKLHAGNSLKLAIVSKIEF